MVLTNRCLDGSVKLDAGSLERRSAAGYVTHLVLHRFAHPLTDTSRTNRL
jgi:hypothetical protein